MYVYSSSEYSIIMQSFSPSIGGLSPRYVIMGFLYFHPMHGYDLHKCLSSDLHEVWHVSQSQVYSVLKNLNRYGLIISTHLNEGKKRGRDLYSLTDQGRSEFITWLYQPTPVSVRSIRVEFISRMYFASQLSGELCDQLIKEQVGCIRAAITELKSRYQRIPPTQLFNQMGLELRIRQLNGVLDWIEHIWPSVLELESM
ncbi:predicted transcriptional regulators [Anaerolinea thermolimosa]|nr:predicted transcriptional regulators [Anaerolinea thermolimosa]